MVEGTVAPGFEGVRAAFERCFEELGETGAGFCALAGGRVVADLRGGLAADALVHLYSVTKLVIADRGRIGGRPRATHSPAPVGCERRH